MFASLFQPAAGDARRPLAEHDGVARRATGSEGAAPLIAVAAEFSPRYERHGDDVVTVDVSGLERLFVRRARPGRPDGLGRLDRPGRPGRVGLPGEAAAAHEASGRTMWATLAGEMRREAGARGAAVHVAIAGTWMAALLASIARPGVTVIDPGGEADALMSLPVDLLDKVPLAVARRGLQGDGTSPITAFKRWGVETLGDVARLPAAELVSRLGPPARLWQAIAAGHDVWPLVPTAAEERFEASLDLEWPIEGFEPLSFVLTRLLEPLSTRLERRDRGAAVLHVVLQLVSRDLYARQLQLSSPVRDVRTLRTLVLLDLDAHPPGAAIDRVTLIIDPTPGRPLQHALFTRAHPTPEQLSTLLARLGALMGQERVGAPATLDSDRPGAFETRPFATDRRDRPGQGGREAARGREPAPSDVVTALRRCRQPVPARVALVDGRPVRVSSDRRGLPAGAVVQSAGPWRTSGNWWSEPDDAWNHDEWDVALREGAVLRIFRDRHTERWFIDGIVD
jgi:protein ImuB